MKRQSSPGFPLALFAAVFLQAGPSHADVTMPEIFGDHMVLQQDLKIPVWGRANPGEKIVVTLGKNSRETIAGANGEWLAELAPEGTHADPLTLTVAGKNTLTFADVLVGDVWLCSGQSNMAVPSGPNGKKDDPQLRFFEVHQSQWMEPKWEIYGKWVVCSVKTAASFSGVGYYFGNELRKTLDRPIGLIGSYVGGTIIQFWMSRDSLQKEPPFAADLKEAEPTWQRFLRQKDAYLKGIDQYRAEKKKWDDKVGNAYEAEQKKWQAEVNEAHSKHVPAPPKPQPASPPPSFLPNPAGNRPDFTSLFYGMIWPLMPYGIKGAIWYQGEGNDYDGKSYGKMLERMITDWREKWKEGDFPFLAVQLPNYHAPATQPVEGKWAWVREGILKGTQSVPNAGMAVTIDLGSAQNLHPPGKEHVGYRLALAAKHVAYGQQLVYAGPLYDSMKVDGKKVRIHFKNTGGGLVTAAPPWLEDRSPVPIDELRGFAIAGSDRKWVWATSKIDGDSVVVWSDRVAAPVAVRYGWADNPPCDLYNKEGLPASPFRTDDWSD